MDRLYRSLESSLLALGFCLVVAAAALPVLTTPYGAVPDEMMLDEIAVSASTAD